MRLLVRASAWAPSTSRCLSNAAPTHLAMVSSSLVGIHSPHLKNGDPEPAPVAGRARLFSMRFCPFAQRAAICLAKKGILTDIVNVNLVAKPDWYFAKNPKGTVPTFELDGKAVFESLIVPEYLDGIFPDAPPILPAEPYTRARQRILVEQLSVIKDGYVGIFMALKGKTSDEDVKAAIGKAIAALDESEKLAANNAPFFYGTAPGYADYMTYPFVDRLLVMLTEVLPVLRPTLAADVKQFTAAGFPGSGSWTKLTAWLEAAQQLDEIRASRQSHEMQAAFLKTYIAGAPEYDIGVR
ncbi:hypothetical protein PFISCL1PPCAC_3360 [Pristionchus fissidentatus]|uniref:Glutathione S-transferase omega n=1 Tax=Pristionchus fissidentatus TaxID=1538716 RepID=A0AAV5UZ56_9BILA|nr:hypothetical protein PFISCL1PPCAC_3360 [Pristionchus fissidentatus]